MAGKKEWMSAAGYTTVYLVVNMFKFVAQKDLELFESIRGTQTFAQIIKQDWHELLTKTSCPFIHQEQFIDESTEDLNGDPRMSIDEVAFVTGIFKGIVLRNYTTPFYKVAKDQFQFDAALKENLQFKTLFLENWDRWEIHIRPTMTGLFIIRLTDYYDHRYGTSSAEFRKIASNVQGLQSSFDVPSALDYKANLEEQRSKGDPSAKEKLKTIDSLLAWLCVDQTVKNSFDYPRVQWQLAQEVCQRFIEAIGSTIQLSSKRSISLSRPKRNITSSFNDSFVLYHFNDLMAPGQLIERKQWSLADWKANRNKMFTLSFYDLHNSPRVKEGIAQLIEGAMLKRPNLPEGSQKDVRRFPRQNRQMVNRLFQKNGSTWNDELCLLTQRSAVIWPSRHARNEDLYISTLPTTTSRVKYIWYWDAMERMLEFIIEVKLLSGLVERESVEALNEFSEALSQMRRDLLAGNLDLRRERLVDLANEAANLSRLVGLCHGLSTPQTWSRAEYAIGKAKHFMNLLEIPALIDHAETNLDNMTNLINHQDELYLANLSERNNRANRRLTIAFFIASVILVVYSLPSFWFDTVGLFDTQPEQHMMWDGLVIFVYWIGNILPILLVAGGAFYILYAWYRQLQQRRR